MNILLEVKSIQYCRDKLDEKEKRLLFVRFQRKIKRLAEEIHMYGELHQRYKC